MNGFMTGFQARVPVPCSATLEPHRPQHGPSRKRSTPGTDMPIPISAIGFEQHSQQTFWPFSGCSTPAEVRLHVGINL
ncbi:hypothetical protein [Pseudomonas viridiflava]|uniref:hypothetical protein n=1 Tax=Pseudomonas syringae group TaxID=136849 RepID=UPI000F054C12|nr:hypothetical protein [Pseudomonas viridiflava]